MEDGREKSGGYLFVLLLLQGQEAQKINSNRVSKKLLSIKK